MNARISLGTLSLLFLSASLAWSQEAADETPDTWIGQNHAAVSVTLGLSPLVLALLHQSPEIAFDRIVRNS